MEEDTILSFEEDFMFIMNKHKNKEDPVPYLIHIISKYNLCIQWYILVQICSYTILFQHNIKNGIKQFVELSEEQKMIINDFYKVNTICCCYYTN